MSNEFMSVNQSIRTEYTPECELNAWRRWNTVFIVFDISASTSDHIIEHEKKKRKKRQAQTCFRDAPGQLVFHMTIKIPGKHAREIPGELSLQPSTAMRSQWAPVLAQCTGSLYW